MGDSFDVVDPKHVCAVCIYRFLFDLSFKIFAQFLLAIFPKDLSEYLSCTENQSITHGKVLNNHRLCFEEGEMFDNGNRVSILTGKVTNHINW